MKNVLVAGCSFTQDPQHNVWIPHDMEGIDVRNIGLSSASNSIISFLVKEQIKLEHYDMVLVQWSAFARNAGHLWSGLRSKIQQEYRLKRLFKRADFIEFNYKEELNDDVLVEHNIKVMEDLHRILKKKNIKHKFYFGWAQIHDFELKSLNKDLVKRMKDIFNSDYFWLYKHDEGFNPENLSFGMTGYNNINWIKHIFNREDGSVGAMEKKNWYPENSFGGMAEYIRDKVGVLGFLHAGIFSGREVLLDGHPNSVGHYIFYKDILKPWIEEIL